MLYLFLGQDNPAKDTQLKRLKQEFLAKEVEQFNFDILYSKELGLKELQERILSLPVKSQKRIILIRAAQDLKEEIQQFIIKFSAKANAQIVLVLDISDYKKCSAFVKQVSKFAKTFRFKETIPPDGFSLNRLIALKKTDQALRILNQLLKEGERPEKILGALRYAWERDVLPIGEMKKRLNFLLNCDIEIKTGKLRPSFALEKLVISLCGFSKPFH